MNSFFGLSIFIFINFHVVPRFVLIKYLNTPLKRNVGFNLLLRALSTKYFRSLYTINIFAVVILLIVVFRIFLFPYFTPLQLIESFNLCVYQQVH